MILTFALLWAGFSATMVARIAADAGASARERIEARRQPRDLFGHPVPKE